MIRYAPITVRGRKYMAPEWTVAQLDRACEIRKGGFSAAHAGPNTHYVQINGWQFVWSAFTPFVGHHPFKFAFAQNGGLGAHR